MRLAAFTVTEITPQLIIDINKLYQPTDDTAAILSPDVDKIVADKEHQLFVATFNNRHIASLLITSRDQHATLSDIVVRAVTRNRGVGSYLLERAITQLKAQGYTAIEYDDCGCVDPALTDFLCKRGFHKQQEQLIFTE